MILPHRPLPAWQAVHRLKVHHVPLNLGRAESNGMFLDEGSSGFVIERNLIYHIDRSPLRFHKAGPLEVMNNAWRPNPKFPELRFNNTDPASIDSRNNRVLEEADLESESKKWRTRIQSEDK